MSRENFDYYKMCGFRGAKDAVTYMLLLIVVGIGRLLCRVINKVACTDFRLDV